MAHKSKYSPALFAATHGVQIPEIEHAFAAEIGRRWRFDFAWVDLKCALEIDGGVWNSRNGKHAGGHSGGVGQLRDMEKHNAATLLGWKVLRCTPKQIYTKELGFLVKTLLNKTSIENNRTIHNA